MSIQETEHGRDNLAFMVPDCPGCRVRMVYKTVVPLLNPANIDQVTYRCPKCGTETQRNVRRP
jgi:hypothetical protein